MIDQRIIDYIKINLSRGVPLDQIKTALIGAGWKEEEISEAIYTITREDRIPSGQPAPAKFQWVSKMRIFIPIIVVVVAVVGIVVFMMFFNDYSPNIPEDHIGTSDIDTDKMSIDIRLPKSTYKIGEKFEGAEYYLRYSGKPFEGIVAYTNSRDGFVRKYTTIVQGEIMDVDFDLPGKGGGLKIELQAFRYNNQGYLCCRDYFYDEGIYPFSISVYDCESVEYKTGKSCESVRGDDLKDVVPLKSKSKGVIVVAGNISINDSIECWTSKDCTDSCENCLNGTQTCNIVKNECLECFMDSMCKAGYKCEDYKCVNDSSLVLIDDNGLPDNSSEAQPPGNDSGTTEPASKNNMSSMKNCEMDFSCFVDSSEDCTPANVTRNSTINLLGIIQNTVSYSEIQGMDSSKCIFYIKTISN